MTIRISHRPGLTLTRATNLANVQALNAGGRGARFHHQERVPGESKTYVFEVI